jgi:hypothetical protein
MYMFFRGLAPIIPAASSPPGRNSASLGEEFSEDRRLENAKSDIEPDPDEEEA